MPLLPLTLTIGIGPTRGIGRFDSFRLACFQICLPKVGGPCGICASFHAGSLEKIAPTFLMIGRGLGGFKFLHGELGVLLAFHNLDDTRRAVSPNIVPNNSKATA